MRKKYYSSVEKYPANMLGPGSPPLSPLPLRLPPRPPRLPRRNPPCCSAAARAPRSTPPGPAALPHLDSLRAAQMSSVPPWPRANHTLPALLLSRPPSLLAFTHCPSPPPHPLLLGRHVHDRIQVKGMGGGTLARKGRRCGMEHIVLPRSRPVVEEAGSTRTSLLNSQNMSVQVSCTTKCPLN